MKSKAQASGPESGEGRGREGDRGVAATGPAGVLDQFRRVRRASVALHEPLSEEDCAVQSMPDASPVKWHLGHTSWFFETLLLSDHLPGYRAFDPRYRVLFNSYYHSVGAQHPRPERGLLTRPSLSEVLSYREHVDDHMQRLLSGGSARAGAVPALTEVGIHHEQQHQELILTDLKHLLSCNPLRPAYRALAETPSGEIKPLRWHWHEPGLRWIGCEDGAFAYDNERPRHQVFLRGFELASRPVSNGEFLAFMGDGGYERPELWLSDGWDTVQQREWTAPGYWEERGGDWQVMTLGGMRPLRLDEPVCHVSYFEADAYARWAVARLPSEAEWEVASGPAAIEGNFVESGSLHPQPAGPLDPEAYPLQLFGDVWEWTASAYTSYPGYRPPDGPLREYNGKFMCNQMVLRGGSCATPRTHIRRSYRNFFPPDARWQFSGIRLARDAE